MVNRVIAETAEILDGIIAKDSHGDKYLLLNGSDNKVWLLPNNNIKGGLQIYQPSSAKGRLAKRLLPYCKEMEHILALLHIESMRFYIKDDINSVIQSALNGKNQLVYTFYIGDSSFVANKKVILQISSDNRILAYAKFTKEKTVSKSFQAEVETLRWLSNKGVTSIPGILWAGNVYNESGFIQSTEKSGNEPIVEKLTANHWKFLEMLYSKTACIAGVSSSDYGKELDELYQLFGESTWESKKMLLNVLEYIRTHYSKNQMDFAFFHGDFTPWNICYKENHIFVFDFEYSHKCFPEWLDPFHFITQVGIMSGNLSGNEIYQQFLNQEDEFGKYMKNPKLKFLCYLVHIIGFYYKRWNRDLSESERSCKVWIQLMHRCYGDLT